MIDLGFLDAPLSPPAALPTADLDAALDQVVSLAERNQFASAGQAAAQPVERSHLRCSDAGNPPLRGVCGTRNGGT